MSDCSISFKCRRPVITEIRDIFSKASDRIFDAIRKLK